MTDIIIRAGFMFAMIALAYILKKLRVLCYEDSKTLNRLILNVTLPCAIMGSFRDFDFQGSLLIIPVGCILANLAMLGVAFLMSRKCERSDKLQYLLNIPGYNIGNFIIPFVAGFLGSTGVVATCFWDMGNAVMIVGFNIMLVGMVISGTKGEKSILRTIGELFTRPSFTMYMVMLLLSITHIRLPDFIFDFAATVAPANGPLAMFMLGLMLEFNFSKKNVAKVMKANGVRICFAVVIAAVFYWLMPFSYEMRKALAITAFAPIPSVAAAYVQDLNGDTELAGFTGTVSIMISLIMIPILIVVL